MSLETSPTRARSRSASSSSCSSSIATTTTSRPARADLLRLMARHKLPGDVMPEITDSMIELSTGVCDAPRRGAGPAAPRSATRWSKRADKLNIGLCGGGTHPFQHWSERRIFDKPRFQPAVASCTATCPSSSPSSASTCTSAARTPTRRCCCCTRMSRYIPHFIALSASSPFVQGTDTGLRLGAAELGVRLPAVGPRAVRADLGRLQRLLRQDDAHRRGQEHEGLLLGHPAQARVRHDRDPRVRHAADDRDAPRRWPATSSALARWLLHRAALQPTEDDYLVYTYNRFQACRFGLDGDVRRPDDRRAPHRCARTSRRPSRALEIHAMELRGRGRHRAAARRAGRRRQRRQLDCARLQRANDCCPRWCASNAGAGQASRRMTTARAAAHRPVGAAAAPAAARAGVSRQDAAVPGAVDRALDHGARRAGADGADARLRRRGVAAQACRCTTTSTRSTAWCCRAAPTSARSSYGAAAAAPRMGRRPDPRPLRDRTARRLPRAGQAGAGHLPRRAAHQRGVRRHAAAGHRDAAPRRAAPRRCRCSTTSTSTRSRFEPGSRLAELYGGLRGRPVDEHPPPGGRPPRQRPATSRRVRSTTASSRPSAPAARPSSPASSGTRSSTPGYRRC